MNGPPFAYVVAENDGWGDEIVAVAPTLAAAARMARAKLPRFNGAAFGKAQRVIAYFAGGDPIAVPLEAFARRDDSETDASVLAWICERMERVAAERARTPALAVSAIAGIGRCSVDDPVDKQLREYRSTADWLWRDDVDETWWQQPADMAVAAGGVAD